MKQKIKQILITLVFAIIGVSFLVSSLTNNNLPMQSSSGLLVNSTNVKIAKESFVQALQQKIQDINLPINDPNTFRILNEYDIPNRILNELAGYAGLSEEVNRLGLFIPDFVIQRRIYNDLNFKDSEGNFNLNKFESALSQMGLNRQTYFLAITNQISVDILKNTLIKNMAETATMQNFFLNRFNEKRDILLVEIKSDEKGMTPTADELTKEYQKNATNYTLPESRTLKVVELNKTELIKQITLTDKEIEADYALNSANYRKPEKRKIVHFLFENESEAIAFKNKVKTASEFNQQIPNYKNNYFDLGLITQSDTEENFAKALFSAPLNVPSEPTATSFGYSVFLVQTKQDAVQLTLKEVSATIKNKLIEQAVEARYEALLSQFQVALNKGESIQSLASENQLSVMNLVVNKKGEIRLSTNNPNLAKATKEAMTTIFKPKTPQQQASFVMGTNFIYQLESIQPSALPPLESIKAELTKSIIAQKITLANENKAKEIMTQINNIEQPTTNKLKAFFNSNKIKFTQSVNISRNIADNRFNYQDINTIFKNKLFQPVLITKDNGVAYLIVSYQSTFPTKKEFDALLTAFYGNQDFSALGLELTDLMLSDLVRYHQVTVNKDLVDAELKLIQERVMDSQES